MKMKQPFQDPRTANNEKLKRIEISFAKQEFTQRIHLLVNNACGEHFAGVDCTNVTHRLKSERPPKPTDVFVVSSGNRAKSQSRSMCPHENGFYSDYDQHQHSFHFL
jgi:hypothetical protein